MAKYIPLDALVVWAKETYLCENASMIRKVCYKQLLEHLDTLEVKEIELSYDDYMRFFAEHPNFPDDWGFDEAWIFAKYFFELGLKAQKGE